MGLLIIGIIVFVAGIILARNSYLLEELGVTLTAIGAAVLLLIGIICAIKPFNTLQFEAKYKVVEDMVDKCDYSDYGQYNALTQQVLDVNQEITKQQALEKSPMLWIMASKKIAEKTLIEIGRKENT